MYFVVFILKDEEHGTTFQVWDFISEEQRVEMVQSMNKEKGKAELYRYVEGKKYKVVDSYIMRMIRWLHCE